MLQKVFNKGQIVLPVEMRKGLGVGVGEMVDVRYDKTRRCIVIGKPTGKSAALGGSLATYGRLKPFPSKRRMRGVLAEALSHEE